MLLTTVLATIKFALRTCAEIASVPAVLWRVAVSISTSEGELTRVGTAEVLKVGGPEVRPTSESMGKMWYTSTSTSLMLFRGVPTGTPPKIVACVITVVVVRKKSSAVSVSGFPALGRRESAPSRPLGLPVEKKNVDANKGVVRHTVNVNAAPIKIAFDIPFLLIFVIAFVPLLVSAHWAFTGRIRTAGQQMSAFCIPI
jgi:hypothetical protein